MGAFQCFNLGGVHYHHVLDWRIYYVEKWDGFFSKMGWRLDTSWVNDPKSSPVPEQLMELVRADSM